MDKACAKEQNGYWSSTCEMFARAGACFVTDALLAKGAKNDYLSGHSECCVSMQFNNDGTSEVIKATPQGKERQRINDAIRIMLNDLFKIS